MTTQDLIDMLKERDPSGQGQVMITYSEHLRDVWIGDDGLHLFCPTTPNTGRYQKCQALNCPHVEFGGVLLL